MKKEVKKKEERKMRNSMFERQEKPYKKGGEMKIIVEDS